MIRVFIVAASAPSRASLRRLLDTRKVTVVGSVPNLESFWEQRPDVEVDVVLVEASGEQFEEVMDSIARSQMGSEAVIAVLSERSEPRWFSEALRAGVRAILPSDV